MSKVEFGAKIYCDAFRQYGKREQTNCWLFVEKHVCWHSHICFECFDFGLFCGSFETVFFLRFKVNANKIVFFNDSRIFKTILNRSLETIPLKWFITFDLRYSYFRCIFFSLSLQCKHSMVLFQFKTIAEWYQSIYCYFSFNSSWKRCSNEIYDINCM